MMDKSHCKTVSVVLATHNGAKYLEEQLQSILAQTFKPLELIVSDDNSTDNTVEIAREVLSRCDFPVRIVRNPCAFGFRDNFLRSSLLAQGDFIAFCDQDDIWHPTKLEKCSKFFEDENVVLIAHTANLIDDSSKKIGVLRQGIRMTTIRPTLSYDPWGTFLGFSMVFRREIMHLLDTSKRFVDYIVPSELIAHDRWITFLSQMVGSTAEINEPLVNYRQHSSNLFGAGFKQKSSSAIDLKQRSAVYIKSTLQMISLLNKFPPRTSDLFPQFDREKSYLFLNAALEQLERRASVYNSPTLLEAFAKISRCMLGGYYRNVHNGNLRWKSMMRDLQVAISH